MTVIPALSALLPVVPVPVLSIGTAGLTPDVLVVFGIIALALVLFVTQPVPVDTTAIAIMVALILLEPWTGVTPEAGVSGFANPATITVLAMFVLSEGVRQTGAIQLLTRAVSRYTGDDELRQLVATIGLAGPPAGFVNNTPVVAILIPAVTDLAKRSGTSPSKLLLPLSFAAMMGGTLTLIGTSSNLLASDVWARQGGPGARPFTMFEFTELGVVVLAVGVVYLLTVGRYLTPARIDAGAGPADEFGMTDYLTEVVVREESSLVGRRVRDVRRDEAYDMDVFQIVRDGRTVASGLPDERIRAGDVLAVRAADETLQQVLDEEHLDLLPEVRADRQAGDGADGGPADGGSRGDEPGGVRSIEDGPDVTDPPGGESTGSVESKSDEVGTVESEPSEEGSDEVGSNRGGSDEGGSDEGGSEPNEAGSDGGEVDGDGTDGDEAERETTLTEVVLLPGAWLSGRPFRITDFQRRHDVTVLAVRRGNVVIRQRMRDVRLQGGDTLLVQATDTTLEQLRADRGLVVSGEGHWESYDRRKIPLALGIVGGVIGLAAANVVPIMVSALAGIVAMIFTGCLRPADAYDAVSWDVIFLLAGVIPLGVAMQESGAADLLGDVVVASGGFLPPLALLGVFYLFTALFTNLVSNNASVVLMIPIALDAAVALDANPFAFVIAVTFAASTAFMTPVGYQTNLMVYGPGGYRFSDFARVGLPLQLLLTVVTTFGIAVFWGV